MREFNAVPLLFALRCIVPLVITLIIGYLMTRLYARWETEAGVKSPAKPKPVPRPATSPVCWLLHGCSLESRAKCPAYQHPDLACWSARMMVEGVLPATCPTCSLFAPVLADQ